MTRRYILIIFTLTLYSSTIFAQDEKPVLREYTDSYLDSIKIEKEYLINDYSMIGIQYGYGIMNTFFNPVWDAKNVNSPVTFGIFYTKHSKMFSLYPYFAFKLGLMYKHSGYEFTENANGYTREIEGATKAVIDVIEMPVLSEFHVDAGNVKILLDAGCYTGYRYAIHRYGDSVKPQYESSFTSYDRRFDYGLKGGFGLGLVVGHMEIHLMGTLTWSLQNLYNPDYYSQYYYRFANPYDINISLGVHYQLGRRYGKTRSQLRREAYEMVYNKEEQ